MSLLRISARLPLRTCLQAANAKCQRQVKQQDNFEGVFDAFCWDEKTGFGTTQQGNLVLVSQEFNKGRKITYHEHLKRKRREEYFQELTLHTKLKSALEEGSELSTKSESDLWQEIIYPTSYISHEALRDELQMNVLSYDNDVVKPDTFTDETTVQTVPIYKGDVAMLTSENDSSPGGQTAGSSTGPRTATA